MKSKKGTNRELFQALEFKNFDAKKRKAMQKLADALKNAKVDEQIIPLIELINSFPQWFTTSSCAGRLAILSKQGVRAKYTATFWYKTHDPKTIPQAKQRLPTTFEGQLWLLVSPPMFHVAARTLEDAILLQQLAKQARLGYSKIQSIRPSLVVEVLGTGMMAVPLGQNGELLIAEEHLDHVLIIAQQMLAEDQQRMWNWYELLSAHFAVKRLFPLQSSRCFESPC